MFAAYYHLFPGKGRNISGVHYADCQAALNAVEGCSKVHEACRSQETTSFLPSRLIDVRSYPHVRLVLCDEITSDDTPDRRYAALSYCWGDAMPESAKATSSSIENFRKQIHMNELPLTHKDAIKYTASIGIPFLWIDALCILQDDKKDWGREIAAMSKIYTQSFLTIAAGASDHCDGGFLKANYEKSELPVPRKGAFGVKADFSPRTEEPNYWIRPFLQNPLFSRGWALQERELAPRIMHFTKTFTVWECREECYMYVRPLNAWTAPDILFLEQTHYFLWRQWPFRCFDVDPRDRRKKRDVAHLKVVTPFDVWQWTVEKFSKRSLTFPGDKLAAMGGLANELQKHVKCDYLAGLWRDDLLRNLLWHRDGHDPVHDAQVLSTSQAPSWSWGNTNFPITFDNDADADEAEVLETKTISEGYPSIPSPPRILIRLRAKVLEVPGDYGTFYLDDPLRKPSPSEDFTVCIVRSSKTLEEKRGEEDGSEVAQKYREGGGLGLVLEAVEGGEAFRRLGMIELVPEVMIEEAKLTEISIV